MESRREDPLIAYTWKRFIDEGATNPEMLVLLPMVKAAVLGFGSKYQKFISHQMVAILLILHRRTKFQLTYFYLKLPE